jgi:hypothetical protein
MKRGTKFLVVCAAIVGGLYLAYLMIFPTAYLRYRLTLDVDVDGVTLAGSGVVEIAYPGMPDWLSEIGQAAHFAGEMQGYAITVDLGARGLLFVVDAYPADPKTHLIAGSPATRLSFLPFAAYGLSGTGSYFPSSGLAAVRELQTKKGPVDIPPDSLPMLVRFRNIDDGDTIEEVDPRDLGAAYGPGVRLARARFEFTTDPVSPMPQAWPKWLASEHLRGFGIPYQDTPISTKAFKGE